MTYRPVEEATNMRTVQVHGDDMIHARNVQHVGHDCQNVKRCQHDVNLDTRSTFLCTYVSR